MHVSELNYCYLVILHITVILVKPYEDRHREHVQLSHCKKKSAISTNTSYI